MFSRWITSICDSNISSTDGASVVAAAFERVLPLPFDAGGRREVVVVVEADVVAVHPAAAHSVFAASFAFAVALADNLKTLKKTIVKYTNNIIEII